MILLMLSTAAYADSESGWISSTVEADIQASADLVFAYTAWQGVLPYILHRRGLIPGVSGTSGVTNPAWDQPGDSRTVNLDDGGTAHEQITRYDRFASPPRFEYQVSAFSNPLFGVAVSLAEGKWVFEPNGASTHVTWTYSFKPRSLAAGVVCLIAKLQYRPYMQQAMDLLKSQLESRSFPGDFVYREP